jgi:acyl-CoA thioester hydrolase
MGGVVYHSNYLNFCERARSDKFFERGLLPYNETGHYVIKNLQANYIRSAKMGDLLEVTAKMVSIANATFVLHQEIFREDEKIFELDVTLVFLGLDGKIKRFEASQKQFLQEVFQ